MSEEKKCSAGSTTYVERAIEGRQCWVPADAATKDYEFAFVEKTDPASGKPFYVNIMTRNKLWELPDISAVPTAPALELAETVVSGNTTFTLCESANGERLYAPKDLPVGIAVGHCWVPRADRIQQRFFYLNASTNEKVSCLPPTLAYCSRVERMFNKYAVSEFGGNFREALVASAGSERSLLSDLVIKYGPEPIDPEEAKETLLAYYNANDTSRLPLVDDELEQWKGREDDLLTELKAKYGAAPPTFRQRVAAMYCKYNPSKLSTLQDAMLQYRNREVQLLAALVQKYGPEPLDAASGPKPSAEETRERVVRMYRKYNPQRLDTVDKSMEVYKGQEQNLIDALVQKYGPEPPQTQADLTQDDSLQPAPSMLVSDPFRDRLSAFYLRYNPGKLQSVPDALQKYAGREEELMEQLVRKYGPEPTFASPPQSPRPDPLARIRQRIKELFELNGLSEKLGAIDDLLALNKGAEDQLLEALELKYGGVQAATPAGATESQQPARSRRRSYTVMASAWCGRLCRLFAKYDPERLSSVDLMLANFAGREDELIQDLVAKYGPEPPDEASHSEEGGAEGDEDSRDEVTERENRNARFRNDEARFLEIERQKLEHRIQREEEAFRKEEEAIVAARIAEAHNRAKEEANRESERKVKDAHQLSSEYQRGKVEHAVGGGGEGSATALQRDVFVNRLHASSLSSSVHFEEALQGIKAQLELSDKRSTTLRDENDRLLKQLTDLRRQCDLELRGMRIHLDEVRARAAKAQSDAQLERVKLQAERDAAEQKILKDVELERIKLAQDVTTHLSERRRLETQIQEQLVQLTLSKSTCLALEEKHEHRQLEVTQLQQEVENLRDLLHKSGAKSVADDGVQTDTPESAHQSQRQLRGSPNSSDIAGQAEEWKARALLLEQQVAAAQHEKKQLEDDLASNLKIVGLLKSKKKQLQKTVGELELKVLAIPDIPVCRSDQDAHMLQQRTEIAQLQQQLDHMDSESRAQKREISDLRNLLSLHLAHSKKTPKK